MQSTLLPFLHRHASFLMKRTTKGTKEDAKKPETNKDEIESGSSSRNGSIDELDRVELVTNGEAGTGTISVKKDNISEDMVFSSDEDLVIPVDNASENKTSGDLHHQVKDVAIPICEHKTVVHIEEESEEDSEMTPNNDNRKVIIRQRWRQVLTIIHTSSLTASPERMFTDMSMAIDMLHKLNPAVYASFSYWLKTCSPNWEETFLERGGFQLLLDVMITGIFRTQTFGEAILQLMVIRCVKRILNSKIGLMYLIEDNTDLVKDFIMTLDTENVMVKNQVFQMLSGVCLYNPEGYELALSSLEYFKVEKNEKHRFSEIIIELRDAILIPYRATVLSFINAILIATVDFSKRIDIRKEFEDLGLLEIISAFRNEDDDELSMQVQVFDEQKEDDDDVLMISEEGGLDLNNHEDVFKAVFEDVAETPAANNLLNILQNLLMVDEEEDRFLDVWSSIDTIVRRIVLTTNEKQLILNNVRAENEMDRLNRGFDFSKEKDTQTECTNQELSSPGDMPPLPSTPPEFGGMPPSPPPGIVCPPPPPPPPPPPYFGTVSPPGAPGFLQVGFHRSASVPTVEPKKKMKKLQWNKISSNTLQRSRNSVWEKVTTASPLEPDYTNAEHLFCQNAIDNKEDKNPETKAAKEINILDGKSSMIVNIFLKQFKGGGEQVITLIKEGKSKELDGDRLRCLEKLLPDDRMKSKLNDFEDDETKLGKAEKFFLGLLGLPNYQFRISTLILKEHFEVTKETLKPSIEIVKTAIQDILDSDLLPVILSLVLRVGNFMNHGSDVGNAQGFKLTSLLKLSDTKANKPRMTLLHYVVAEAESKNKTLLEFPSTMSSLEKASRQNVEYLEGEVNMLRKSLQATAEKLTNLPDDLKEQFQSFVDNSTIEVAALQKEMVDIRELTTTLADYFCEDTKRFVLEDTLNILKEFCQKLEKAKEENDQRKKKEERERLREQKAAEEKARKEMFGLVDEPERRNSRILPPVEETCIIDNLLDEVRKGFPLKKLNMSHENTNTREANFFKKAGSSKGEKWARIKAEKSKALINMIASGKRSLNDSPMNKIPKPKN